MSDFIFTFHFPLSCIGEGSGNPLQCSCLETPKDGGSWWAASCGDASRDWLLLLLLLQLLLPSRFSCIRLCANP